jgi:hypothetical protein
MAKTNQDDTFYANNQRVLKFTVVDSDNGDIAFDLTGYTIKWALSKYNSKGAYLTTEILGKSTTGGGVVVTNAAGGLCEVTLDGADTASLSGAYYHELEATDGLSVSIVLATGKLTILKNVVNT